MTTFVDQGRSRGRATRWIIVAAAVVLVLAGAAVGAAAFIRQSDKAPAGVASSPTGLPVATEVECALVKTGYEAWADGKQDFDRVPETYAIAGTYHLDRLLEDGKAFLKAVDPYEDQPAKKLKVAIATYNVEVGFVRLENMNGGQFVTEHYKTAATRWTDVQRDYESFRTETCKAP